MDLLSEPAGSSLVVSPKSSLPRRAIVEPIHHINDKPVNTEDQILLVSDRLLEAAAGTELNELLQDREDLSLSQVPVR
ncbi:hypothetical protein ElyMa_002010700 [Elysia marginata]|uniref:PDZ domain-containing protein n=1 Tax=Elysia marginata TaxID=1093978 RepID=A0AAV4F592_9GAST|nr:hypothetical protein ElyMa_002010700 [Elysia marginata]